MASRMPSHLLTAVVLWSVIEIVASNWLSQVRNIPWNNDPYNPWYGQPLWDGHYPPMTATCALRPDPAYLVVSNLTGTIKFSQFYREDVKVIVNLRGLDTSQGQDLRLHTKGDLSQGCRSTGPHYNPGGRAGRDARLWHLGDLTSGQVAGQTSGTSSQVFSLRGISLYDHSGIIGRAVVVHSRVVGQDGQGERIACCVIGREE